jgi:hypothetical protein
MPNILKLASHHFVVYPFIGSEIRRRLPTLYAFAPSLIPHDNYFAMHPQLGVSS